MNGSGSGNTNTETGLSVVTVNTSLDWKRRLDPDNWEQLAKTSNTIGKAFGVAPEVVAAKIIAGSELGLSAMQSYRGIHIIEGQPALSANLKEALCKAHPSVCEKFELKEWTEEKCTYTVKRRGQKERDYTFTMAEAKAAGLVDRGKDPKMNNWNRYPKRMLAARAKSLAADMEFSDLLLSFPTMEDMEDERRIIGSASATVDGAPVEVEVLSSTSAKPHPSPEIDAPARDIVKEVDELKEAITAAKTPDEKASVRKRVATFASDLGDCEEVREIKAFYNMIHAPAKTTPDAEKGAPVAAEG